MRQRRGRMELVEAISRAASADYLVLAGPTQQGPEANVYATTWIRKIRVLIAVSRSQIAGASSLTFLKEMLRARREIDRGTEVYHPYRLQRTADRSLCVQHQENH